MTDPVGCLWFACLLAVLVLPLPWGVRKNIARTLMRPVVRKGVDTSLRYVGAFEMHVLRASPPPASCNAFSLT